MHRMKWHGEAILTQVDELPVNAKKLIPNSSQVSGNGFIIAESETTGNHHCVELNDSMSIYETDERDIFIEVKEASRVYNTKGVLGASGHTDIELEPGIWRISHQQQYNPLTKMRERVAD